MTNAEKFQEVFNLPISKKMPDDPCSIIDENFCIKNECGECPLYHFWEKEFQEVKND